MVETSATLLLLATLVLALAAQSLYALPVTQASGKEIELKFDELSGAGMFKDSSSHHRNAKCVLSGARCPTAGAVGVSGKAAWFGKGCTVTYNSAVDVNQNLGGPALKHNEKAHRGFDDRDRRVRETASCGSEVSFNPVHIRDGTVMTWYKEGGEDDGSATKHTTDLPNDNSRWSNQPSGAPGVNSPNHNTAYTHTTWKKTKWRLSKDNGWDLSLVGGPDFFVGRLSGVYWGGYWCGKWHVARPGQDARKHDQMSPNFGSGDSWSGWDHLGWHHMAVVFSGSSAIVYIDGKRVVVFTNTGECQKQISFLGKRTVRYTEQAGHRETEFTNVARPRNSKSGALNYQLQHGDWSNNYFHGLMDEFRVYRTALGASAINAAMNNS